MYLTASRIKDALACPKKYKLGYIDKIYPEKKAISLVFGDVLHQAVERFHKGTDATMPDLVGERWLKTLGAGDYAKLLMDYQDLLDEQKDIEIDLFAVEQDIMQKKPETKAPKQTKAYKEAKEAAYAPFAETTAALQTRAANITLNSDYRFTSKGPIELYDDSLKIGAAYEEYWMGLEEKPEIVSNEASFKIPVHNFTLGGKIDRMDLNQMGELEILDYKTNVQEQSYLESFVQNVAYYLGAKELFGERPVAMKYYYLRLGREVRYELDDSMVGKLVELMNAVKNIHMLPEHHPTFNTCGWCNYFGMCMQDYGYKEMVLSEPAVSNA